MPPPPFLLIGAIIGKIIAIWKVVATIVSMVSIFVIIYAGVRFREVLMAEKKKIGHLPDWTSDKKKKNELFHISLLWG